MYLQEYNALARQSIVVARIDTIIYTCICDLLGIRLQLIDTSYINTSDLVSLTDWNKWIEWI